MLNDYNLNTYLKLLQRLYNYLPSIQNFLDLIEKNQNFKYIDDLKNIYVEAFNDETLINHIEFSVSKIYKPLYLSDPGPHNKSNSYNHIKLKLKSKSILELDKLYEHKLSRTLRFYKHLFSKIDNFFITLKSNQIDKYNHILLEVKDELEIFLKSTENRELISQRKKLDTSLLNKIPFGGLFHITHIDNVPSILKYGILSHNKAHQSGIVKIDISNQTVNQRRDRIEPDLDGNIHDFTPLYFNHKNPMMFALCKQKEKKDLVLIRVNPHILLSTKVYFSDGNASVKSTRFYNDLSDFNKLNWDLLNAGSWNDYEFGIKEGRRLRCSEVLVKNKIPKQFINDIFVYDQNSLDKILNSFPNHLGIVSGIDNNLYF
ncbi:DUF4433 domain-containing protein [Psychroflexus gondwanensis]|jgi:hypothetical protein|uniref:DUF4433 domain-containing protein n=1 Tax=Psychroflexus gondwanensis TaxID=251 RepID=UPI0011BF625B|nr:DUF4433 domain-containing protein [Psychroflexus gondwanensis]TXE15675.1 DUF4433 domain-containing protein [Psychroflexus gondwanensis]